LLSGEDGEAFCRGSIRFYVDMPWLVGLYQAGRLPIDKLSGRHYLPDQYNKALRALEVRGIARSLLDVTQL
jgi:Zn-dependent alcohol dehydrogenase